MEAGAWRTPRPSIDEIFSTRAAGGEPAVAASSPPAPSESDARYLSAFAPAPRVDKATLWAKIAYSSDEDDAVLPAPIAVAYFGSSGVAGGSPPGPPFGVCQGFEDVALVAGGAIEAAAAEPAATEPAAAADEPAAAAAEQAAAEPAPAPMLAPKNSRKAHGGGARKRRGGDGSGDRRAHV